MVQVIHPFETTDNAYLKAHISLISPKETGYMKEILFEDSQKVAPGDLLVVIDDYDFQARVAEAEAQVLMEKRTSTPWKPTSSPKLPRFVKKR